MYLSRILLGIASLFFTIVAETGSSQPRASAKFNSTEPPLNGSARNPLVHCDREKFGHHLLVESCSKAVMAIRQDESPKIFAMRNSGQRFDIPLPHRTISRKSLWSDLIVVASFTNMREFSGRAMCNRYRPARKRRSSSSVDGRNLERSIFGAQYLCSRKTRSHRRRGVQRRYVLGRTTERRSHEVETSHNRRGLI